MSNIRRVLVVQPYGIGDLLFLTPVLRALRLLPSVEKVDLLLGSRTEAVVKNNPHIDQIMIVNKDLMHVKSAWQNLREMAELIKKLKSKNYDLLLDYSMRHEYALAAQFLLGIPKRAGFAYKKNKYFYNVSLCLKEGFRDKSVVEYVCDLAEMAGVPVRDKNLEFYLSPEVLEPAHQKLKMEGAENWRYIVVSPGGGESWGKESYFKQWPAERFSEFVGKLKSRYAFDGIISLGSEKENDLIKKFQPKTDIKTLNLAGKTTLEESAAILSKALLFVGNDGGLLHLANALKVPTIGFFGPVDPKIYGPFPSNSSNINLFKADLECRPCYKRFRFNSACENRACLQDFSVDDAMAILDSKNYFSLLKMDFDHAK